MPASIRVIAIVKNPVTNEDAYTIEFECIAEDSADLIKELLKNPLGKRAIELINKAKFMPEEDVKTPEELRKEAEEEAERIRLHDEQVRKAAIAERDRMWKRAFRNTADYIKKIKRQNVETVDVKETQE